MPCGRWVDWAGVVAAASAPFADCAPELVVEQPFACPGQDGLGDWIAWGPLAGFVKAKAAIGIDVGQAAVGIGDELWATHEDAGVIRWRVTEVYKVFPTDLTGLEFAGPPQHSGLQP